MVNVEEVSGAFDSIDVAPAPPGPEAMAEPEPVEPPAEPTPEPEPVEPPA